MIRRMEKGQSMILITALLFAFFAILALVIDGGFLYYMRRNAQNAADAGALAGADYLCKFEDTLQASNVARSTALDNNVTTAAASAVWVDPGGYVEVNTTVEYHSFFARLLNLDRVDPPAYAKAGCAPPGNGIGVLPIAWSCRPPNVGENSDSDDCALHYMIGPECSIGQDNMYIIVDSQDIEEDVYCQDPPNSGLPNPDYLDCDFDNVLDENGKYHDDLTPLSGGNRSWLDLDGGGGGNIGDWVINGFPGTIRPHTWIGGKTGAATDVYKDVALNQMHKSVVIPVFNDLCITGSGDPRIECPEKVHPEDTVVPESGAVDYFHIISFSYFHVECVEAQGFGPCPVNKFLDLPPQLKTIEGCFVEGYVPSMGGEPGQGIDAGVYTTFLME